MATKKEESSFSAKYFDPQKSILAYTGDAAKFSKQFPKKSKQAKQWLQDQEVYSLHKPARKKGIQGNRTITSCVDAQWQADLADMQKVSKDNDGNRFLLTVIDVLSRYAWAVPIKDKRGETVINALREIFKSSGRFPQFLLQTDQGTEFFNPHMKKLASEYGFHHFHSDSDHKAALVERFNRTLKTYIYRYFTYKQTNRYVDVLPHLVDAYNRRIHSAHGKAPIKVTHENEEEVFETLYPHLTTDEMKKYLRDGKQFQIGDHVRISKLKGLFEKGYLPNWTTEIFVISDKKYKYPRVTFYLKDLDGEEITGSFYSEHLQKTTPPEFYLVEKVVRTRKPRRGEKEYLVKWRGYPDKFNSWVKESDIKDLIDLRADP